ncbi:MAG: 3-phosphoserine/phosphohydroxythreonine transaminase [Phycisphaerales bacterium]
MSDRVYNFSAGPACLPESVLKQAQKDLWNIFESGIGILEHSHRNQFFDRITYETEAACREVGNIPSNMSIFWMQGGATSQCYMVPANFLPEGRTADYFQTGKWANDSIDEVHHYGNVHICGSSKDKNYNFIPKGDQVRYSENPAYVQFTSNNTIMGTEFKDEPTPPKGAFLVADMSSNIYSRPMDFSKFGLVYAGAQKNLGPSGITLLIGKKELINNPVRELPKMMQYGLCAKKEGRYNTPPTFGVYLMGEVFKWIKAEGGLTAMAERNREKAAVIYDFIDSQDFFTPHAVTEDRSDMNITFKCPTEQLDEQFTEEAEKKGLTTLAGHRSIGGMRASIYNAFPKAGCEALVAFMKEFAHTHAGATA